MKTAISWRYGLRRMLVALMVLALFSGCSGGLSGAFMPSSTKSPLSPPLVVEGPITPTPFQPLPPTKPGATPLQAEPSPSATPAEPTPTPEIVQTPTAAPRTLWAAPDLPAAFQESLSHLDGVTRTARPEEASLRLEVGGQAPVSTWVYALVAPFPTVEDGVSFKALRRCWQGEAAGPFGGLPLLVDESTLSVFSALWGEPAQGAVKVLESSKLLNAAWKEQPSWALLPFESLGPRWKVLEVDGQSPVRKQFDAAAYPLVVPISLVGPEDQAAAIRPAIPSTNRDPGRLTTVVMTGVTALVRATAYLMERDGITSPAEYIGDWLREADILHISNEIPFAPNCPFPDPQQAGLRFCSAPRYIKLLEEIGTDVVELTGDHFADWGADATLYTLEMYRERGWPYYGGGENIEDARKPVIFEHNGNRIAFIGCNGKGGGYATARENAPGAVACDYDWMHAEIARLRKKGILPIVTFQHVEVYAYNVPPDVRDDFVGMAEAGAVIVSGSQAHQPHGMEFADGAFVHFGLGNLFFDQYRFFSGPETDRAFIDRHVFYNGRYISTELLTMYFVNLSHGRPMTTEERAAFLDQIFSASGW